MHSAQIQHMQAIENELLNLDQISQYSSTQQSNFVALKQEKTRQKTKNFWQFNQFEYEEEGQLQPTLEGVDFKAVEIDSSLKEKKFGQQTAFNCFLKDNKNLTINSNFEAESNVSTTASSNQSPHFLPIFGQLQSQFLEEPEEYVDEESSLGCQSQIKVQKKSNNQVLLRRKHQQKAVKKSVGRWSNVEKERFREGVRRFGGDWAKVEDFVGTRSTNQIQNEAKRTYPELFLHPKAEQMGLEVGALGKQAHKSPVDSNRYCLRHQQQQPVPSQEEQVQGQEALESHIKQLLVLCKKFEMSLAIERRLGKDERRGRFLAQRVQALRERMRDLCSLNAVKKREAKAIRKNWGRPENVQENQVNDGILLYMGGKSSAKLSKWVDRPMTKRACLDSPFAQNSPFKHQEQEKVQEIQIQNSQEDTTQVSSYLHTSQQESFRISTHQSFQLQPLKLAAISTSLSQASELESSADSYSDLGDLPVIPEEDEESSCKSKGFPFQQDSQRSSLFQDISTCRPNTARESSAKCFAIPSGQVTPHNTKIVIDLRE